ncbi:MAG: hypothetical protein V2A79_14025 [Planctomycetota bacterium]
MGQAEHTVRDEFDRLIIVLETDTFVHRGDGLGLLVGEDDAAGEVSNLERGQQPFQLNQLHTQVVD